jgi:hypothetical protein
MDPLHDLAERRLREAIEAGAFDDYPGKGEPLELEDLSHLAEDLRPAYIALKGHGFVSEELELCTQITSLGALIASACNAGERDELQAKQRKARLAFALLLERRGVPSDVIERLSSIRP